jgi:hypothetical protein|tara:strand:+ start:12599 stop:12910 length:312 start_codon:yes stop_codon:yes gene_type:complete
MIKKFKELLDDDADMIDIDALLSEEDKESYNKWLSIFTQLTPFNIPTGLQKVIDDNELEESDEVVLLAYMKFFEQRIFQMAKAGTLKNGKKKTDSEYDGAMFG